MRYVVSSEMVKNVGFFAFCEQAGEADEVTSRGRAMSEDVYRISY
jgi:hypothetical protein